MKRLVYLSLFLLLFCSGCSSDSDSPVEPPAGADALTSGTIGSGGGGLTSEEVILDVPAGALASDANVKIFVDTVEEPFGDQTASSVLRIEGLPDGFSLPITLKLAHGAAHADSLFALVGSESWVPSLQELRVNWGVSDCRDSLGWAIFDIQPATATEGKADTTTPLHVTTVKGVSYLETSDSHFRIYWSPLMATTAQIVKLRDDFEYATALYDLMGWEQTNFDAWPIKVLVKPLNWYGHFAPGARALGGHLAISTKYLHDEVETSMTVGHELLHFCQYFYDPRTVWERSHRACPHSWLSEAASTYIEEYFCSEPGRFSTARGGRELTALDGLIAPAAGRKLADHGYGQSSILRYLSEVEGDEFILKAYQDIATGTHAAAALQNQTETDITDVWQDFLEELVAGKVYPDVTLPVLLKYGVYYMQTINSPADSVGSHGMEYPDLSGQSYYVNWGAGYFFNDNQRLEFWCDASEYGLSIFGVKEPDTLDLLGHAYGKVVVTNLENVKEKYQSVMALVSNHHLEGPEYWNATPITIQSRLRETENIGRYDHASVRIKYEADWSTSPDNTYGQEMNFSEVWGTFSGTTFTASWDSVNSSGTQRTGHVIITLDPATMQVTSWSARNSALGEDGSTSDFQASGGAIPDVFANSVYLDAVVTGEESCASINNLSVTFVNDLGEVTRNLDGYNCNPSSYVKVYLKNRDPD